MNEITWEIPVAVDLFFAGVGAGSFCLGAITARKKGPGWEACSRMSSFLAPLAVVMGLSMLILDLRNKTRFWMTLRVLNASSPMSIGVWLLSAFFLVSLIFALYGLPVSNRKRIPWIGTLSVWNRLEWKNTLGIVGILLALGVSVYTGVLLLVSIVPLWRNLSLPLLLFLSAISTGFAGGTILAMLSLGRGNPDVMKEPLRFIKRSYRVILPFYLLMAFAFVSSLIISSVSRTDAIYLITGWSGFIWWAGVIGVGILVPLIFVMKKEAIAKRRAWVIFGCVLIGGFLLRIVLILAGQRS
jgi:formate-dependent nitrite reductase membrane component NrfD